MADKPAINTPAIPAAIWDERYAQEGFAYGSEPNEFLVASLAGRGANGGAALCLAEGEGRNAIHLAKLGYRPLAVDQSATGLAKAAALARTKGVEIETRCLDLNDYNFPANAFALAISIWAHLPPELRRKVHRGVATALQPGGLFVLEAYHPRNIGRGTGGPQEPHLCMTAADLREDVAGLEILHLQELERVVEEGPYHKGLAAVTQLVARRPG